MMDLGTVPEDEELLLVRAPSQQSQYCLMPFPSSLAIVLIHILSTRQHTLPAEDCGIVHTAGQGGAGGLLSALLEHRVFLYVYSTLLLAFSLVALVLTVRHGGPTPIDIGPGTTDAAAASEPANPTLRLEGYDFIVVGAGPAGSVMARKLSDDPNRTVLLIEAGGPTQRSLGGKDYIVPGLTMFDVPLVWSTVAHYDDYHWDVKDAMIARGLGGCGIHNAMLYVRALERDFDVRPYVVKALLDSLATNSANQAPPSWRAARPTTP